MLHGQFLILSRQALVQVLRAFPYRFAKSWSVPIVAPSEECASRTKNVKADTFFPHTSSSSICLRQTLGASEDCKPRIAMLCLRNACGEEGRKGGREMIFFPRGTCEPYCSQLGFRFRAVALHSRTAGYNQFPTQPASLPTIQTIVGRM